MSFVRPSDGSLDIDPLGPIAKDLLILEKELAFGERKKYALKYRYAFGTITRMHNLGQIRIALAKKTLARIEDRSKDSCGCG